MIKHVELLDEVKNGAYDRSVAAAGVRVLRGGVRFDAEVSPVSRMDRSQRVARW
ncbi:MAG: hypothetical protein GZ093_19600 [Rhodoferax sp.]|uniref:hypothetical protein n=1 Tax=Rhodoferax sp. TaxID=50421 RepID=UPI001401AE9D|nr:hypothetical protein [Rhodoferax sp.]NDP40900.1 hypothetical protein [Rhodoferax sp.]